jgi:cobalt/nickel transport system permease protein
MKTVANTSNVPPPDLHGSGAVHFSTHLDPRSYLLVAGGFITLVVSVPKFDLTAALLLSAFPFFILLSGQLPLKPIGKRLLLLSPFILFMAGANVFFDRRPVALTDGITLTAGTLSALVILIKTLACLTTLLLLSGWLPFHRICAGLRGFRVPEVFVTQLMLLYRYCFVLVAEAAALEKARRLRSFGRRGREWRVTAKMLGTLLLRTLDRSERIYRAMASRGFTGSLAGHSPGHWTVRDFAFISSGVLFPATIRFFF